jgi:hypothetical protein
MVHGQTTSFTVSFYYPTNGQQFAAGANIPFYLRVADTNVVRTVQYYSNGTLLRTITNTSTVLLTNSTPTSVFSLTWSNVPAGSYTLTAVGTDTAGLTATSPPVNINVTNVIAPNVPYFVSFWYPTNGQHFVAPATVGLHALVTDSNVVRTMQYFSGATSIGIVTNTGNVPFTNSTQGNPFFLAWSNVPAGNYPLTAVATDVTGLNATSAVVNIIVTNPVPICYIFSPTNNSVLLGPTNVTIYARAVEVGGTVASVSYYANSLLLGTVPAGLQSVFTNVSTEPLIPFTWSNAPLGSYALRVVATDTLGASSTSSVVNISIVSNLPPVRPFVAIYSPTNGTKFVVPANIGIYAHAYEGSTGTVASVEFFANSVSLGVVSNGTQMVYSNISSVPLFALTWSNAPVGGYYLKAVATDAVGMTSTSSLVSISVITNTPPPPPIPFVVNITYPTNGQTYTAPATVVMRALAVDSNLVKTVQFFASGTSLGIVSNTATVPPANPTAGTPFYLFWSNAPAGSYSLTAIATDSAGNNATSGPVNISVVSNTVSPVVTIYAPDPVAIEGTNYLHWNATGPITNYINGTNTATFLVRRDSGTNVDLTVAYAISGTATNGVDYQTIPTTVTIPAGQRYSLITIVPLNDSDSAFRRYDNVVLTLAASTNAPPSYVLGSTRSAGAVILEEDYLPIVPPTIHSLADTSVHISLPATNGMNYCLQVSTDLVNWVSVSTNTVIKSSAQYVDTQAGAVPGQYYRIVPLDTPPSF